VTNEMSRIKAGAAESGDVNMAGLRSKPGRSGLSRYSDEVSDSLKALLPDSPHVHDI
jgi:hypothetical protein